MRKGAGISALSRHTATTSSYSTLSATLGTSSLASLQASLDTFRASLLDFAAKHRADIRADPAFRHQFQKMCAAIGIDPLAGGGGGGSGRGAGVQGWFAEALGLGEWQYGLAVQVVDVCVSTREANGGVIEMGELVGRVERMRQGGAASTSSTSAASASASVVLPTPATAPAPAPTITADDVSRALELLRPLATYAVLSLSGKTYVRSVPRELDTDQTALLSLASAAGGRLTPALVVAHTGWQPARARHAVDECVMREGMGWVDAQDADGVVWVLAAVAFE
ncbi:ESCRT II complex subunit Dot2 [Cryptotrichosporon argae]